MRFSALFAIVTVAIGIAVSADEPTKLKTSELAAVFGTAPIMWGMRLSPDGTNISAIQMDPSGVTVARVVDFTKGTNVAVLAGRKGEFEIGWCDWANEERLLCGLRGLVANQGLFFAATRLVSVATDGDEIRPLVDRRLDGGFTQFQDRVLDWLPDDREHVLIQVPTSDGSGVSRLNIYDGDLSTEERPKASTYDWISDGHGSPRLYQTTTDTTQRWYARSRPESPWELLREIELTDTDSFSPIGFGNDRDELLFFDKDGGRTALFALNLVNAERRLVYANEEFDVASVLSLGKYRRLVAAAYVAERTHLTFFDKRIAGIHEAVAMTFPGKSVAIIDESWDQRFYIMLIGSATDPGTYYRFDVEAKSLARIVDAYPSLANTTLADVKAITYPAEDGVQIPAYLTLPTNSRGKAPTVILPHGGPSARDYWTYDFLAQFLAAKGYAVLQSNYRGSDGYGSDWLGEGGFRGWRRALGDITAGTKYLVDEGIADPDRICTVGWSYGGYAALMSVVERGDLYRCVVSIAGVTDPRRLSSTARRFVGGLGARTFIGAGEEVFARGSPRERAEEVGVPVLLVHPRKDANVPFAQSDDFASALKRAGKDVEFVEYEEAEHDIQPERYRIDLLTRLGEFLDAHIGH